MSLAVVGAGLGRTGTLALKRALERLGLARCYHMLEVRENPGHAERWSAAAEGESVDWDALFAGYRAAVDWPACHFWGALATHYPESKVILTVRDPQAWYESARRTIYEAMQQPVRDPARAAQRRMARKIILEQAFGGRFEDRAHAIAVFNEHAEAVRAALPAGRLLVLEVAEGWEPLCRFLDRPVPLEPFPHVNTTAEFRAAQGLEG